MEIVLFFASVLGMLMDPLTTGGCLLAGILIKNYWGALTAGVAWVLILQIAIVIPASKAAQANYPPIIMVYAIFAALIATSIAFGIAKLFRKSKSKETAIESDQSNAQ